MPDPRIKFESSASLALAGRLFNTLSHWESPEKVYSCSTQDLYKCQIIFLESFPSQSFGSDNISFKENLSSAHYVLTFFPRFLTLLFFLFLFLINGSLKYYELYVWLVSKCFFIHLDILLIFIQTNGFLKEV